MHALAITEAGAKGKKKMAFFNGVSSVSLSQQEADIPSSEYLQKMET